MEMGWKVTVFSVDLDSLPSSTRFDFELGKDYLEGLNVIRVKAPFSYKVLTILRRTFPFLALMPDDHITWATRLVRKIQSKYAAGDFDVMITFGHPWSDHLAGLEVKKILNLPWVAHFSDPWADNPYYTRLSRMQLKKMRAQESKVIDSANAIVFTSNATVDRVMSKYPEELRTKAFVVPHGFDTGISPAGKQTVIGDRSQMKLVHTGNLYGFRTPETMLNSLVRLKNEGASHQKIKVIFVGRIKNLETWQTFTKIHNLQDMVQFIPPVSYKESLDFAKQADVLLLIDAPSENESIFLPSKLIDYLAFDKPILGLTPLRGASADLLRRLGCFIAPPDDVKEVTALLNEILKSWQADQLRVGRQFKGIANAEYDIRNTTNQLARVLIGVL